LHLRFRKTFVVVVVVVVGGMRNHLNLNKWEGFGWISMQTTFTHHNFCLPARHTKQLEIYLSEVKRSLQAAEAAGVRAFML
jgi:hypothetical protein